MLILQEKKIGITRLELMIGYKSSVKEGSGVNSHRYASPIVTLEDLQALTVTVEAEMEKLVIASPVKT